MDQKNVKTQEKMILSVETGLSDFHKMVVTVKKTSYQTIDTQVIYFQDHSVFNDDKFRELLHKF